MKVSLVSLLIASFTWISQPEVCAQATYGYSFNAFINEAYIYELGPDDELILLATLDETAPIFGDIAVAPDGQLYGLSQAGVITLIDIENQTTIPVYEYSVLAGHTAFGCDGNFNCYTINFWYDLYSYNLITQEEQFIVNLGEYSPGDLGFYQGFLVFVSSEGFIKALDLETLEVTRIYCLPPEMIEMKSIWGISNWFESCDEEYIIAVTNEDEFFKINIETNSFELLDTFYDIEMEGEYFGMGSGGDPLASACNGTVTETDCTETFVTSLSNSENRLFYPNPVQHELTFTQPNLIQEVLIFDAYGALCQLILQPSGTLNLNHLDAGMYVVHLQLHDGSSLSERLVKL